MVTRSTDLDGEKCYGSIVNRVAVVLLAFALLLG